MASQGTSGFLVDLDYLDHFSVHSAVAPLGSPLDQFQSTQKAAYQWRLWEAGSTEGYVAGKTKSGDLPCDDTQTAIEARNQYREKVIDFLRDHNPTWLKTGASSNGQVEIDGTPAKAARALTSALLANAPASFQQLISVLTPGIRAQIQVSSSSSSSNSSYRLTLVDHAWDQTLQRFSTAIRQLKYTLSVSGDNVKGQWLLQTWSFAENTWNDVKKGVANSVFKIGEEATKGNTLYLAAKPVLD